MARASKSTGKRPASGRTGRRAEDFNPGQVVKRAMRELHDGVEGTVDPLGMAAPLVHAQLAWLAHPQELAERFTRLSTDLWKLQLHSVNRMLGLASSDPIRPHSDDARFADPVWTEYPTWDLSKEWYLAFTRNMQDMLYDTPGLASKERRRAAFWWRNLLNAMAPTNFLWTNPVAMRKAVETNGESLTNGFKNFLEDLKAGNVRMTDPDDFHVGENLATTPGEVVFRNNLLEVIHYAPTQPKVHAKPIVIVTPWINKFYILDLVPRKSMIRFLLDQGMDVFITSWKNPGASMRDCSFDDYLTEGVHAIIECARSFTRQDKVHAVGYCIGGTALSMYMAWANRHFPEDQVPVADWTLLTTLVDFHKPGDIEVFIDEASIRYIIDNMASKGYLDGKEMASAFRLLRSNGLIWHYVVQGWLYGETPPPFDVLYWNMDTTRMPYAMHSWYLRELYLNNKLIHPDALEVAGEPLDLGRITQPLYVVSAEDDHIAPWLQTFRVINHVTGPKRYVLSSSGHILGIVNPVVTPPKRKFWAGEAHRSDTAEQWRNRTEEQAGSWWTDWMDWVKPHAGELIEARPAASEQFPSLAPAPGTYVLES
tara:strand:+ start:24257 stop:26041 length:1785 start_codon:yes stop_codon:yes gene_type:complete